MFLAFVHIFCLSSWCSLKMTQNWNRRCHHCVQLNIVNWRLKVFWRVQPIRGLVSKTLSILNSLYLIAPEPHYQMAPIGLKCDGTCTYSISLGRGRKSGGAQSSPPSLAPMVMIFGPNIKFFISFNFDAGKVIQFLINSLSMIVCFVPLVIDHNPGYKS